MCRVSQKERGSRSLHNFWKEDPEAEALFGWKEEGQAQALPDPLVQLAVPSLFPAARPWHGPGW